MRRIQHDTMTPTFLTDNELVRYASIYAADELPKAWLTEIIKRFIELVDVKHDAYDASHE